MKGASLLPSPCFALLLTGLCGLSLSCFSATNPPAILVQPRGGEEVAGGSWAFDVLADGTQPFAYQWWWKPSAGADFLRVPEATNLVLSLTNLQDADAGQYRVVVANSAGGVTSSIVTLTVSDPAIWVQPQGASRDAGTNSFTFAVDARGTPPLHFQWQTNDVEWAGQTNSSLTLPALTKANEGSYRVIITNSVGNVISDSVQLTVHDPAIQEQPVGGVYNQGDSATLSITAAGSQSLSYQWLFYGIPIAGATNRTLIFTNDTLEISRSVLEFTSLTNEQSGYYAVRISNAKGTVASITANLVVYALAITNQPTNITVNAEQNVTNTVGAAGTPPLVYQWYFKTNTTAETNIVAGATNSWLILTNVLGAQAGSYWVEITNSKGTNNSIPFSLIVIDPIITNQPHDGAIEVGDSFTNVVAAVGTKPLSYRWFLNGAALAGATNATLILTNVTLAQAGNYSVTITNAFGRVTSASAALTVYDLAILSQPQGGWRAVGESFEFWVTARGTQPVSYQWYHDGDPIPGETRSNLVLTSVTASDIGAYWVAITNAAGRGLQSTHAYLTVFDPVIRQQPNGGEALPGTNFSFVVVAGGTSPFSYEWFFNDVPVGLPVQTAASTNLLTITNVNSTHSGAYWVRVTNTAGSVLSAQAVLTVNDPFIVTQPQGGQVDAGDSFTYEVKALGTPPLTYQWFLNGAMVAGATNSTLLLTNITASQGGAYFVDVSNPIGTQRSESATLLVQDPAIREQPLGGTVAIGEGFTFHVMATGTRPIIYQWFFNGAAMPGKVEETLVLSDLTVQAGQYSVQVRNAEGSRSSASANLTISPSAPRTIYNGFFSSTSTEARCGVSFQGNGMENGIAFSVGYDPHVLAHPTFSLGTNEPVNSATLTTEVDEVAGGIGVVVQLPDGTTFPSYPPQWVGTVSFDVIGTNALDGSLRFTNSPVELAAVDLQGDRLALSSGLTPAVTFLDLEPLFHVQSGLFVQRWLLGNPTAVESTQAVVDVGGLGVDSLSNTIVFVNAHTGDYLSDPDGDGVVDTVTRAAQVELARGQEIPVTLEFYVSDRTTVPAFDAYGASFGSLNLQPPSGGVVVPVGSARYITNEFLVDFLTQSDSTYYLQYADSLQHLANPATRKTAFPPVIGTGTFVQWIDNGPPKTASPPSDGMRFYQVIRSP